MAEGEKGITIRRVRKEDVENVHILCKLVRNEASTDELFIHLRRFLIHPYLHSVILLFFGVLYSVVKLSATTSILVCFSLIIVVESVRFHWFWSKFQRIFRGGSDLENLIQHYSNPKRFFLVASVDGVVAGTVAVIETDRSERAKLFRMFVHPNYRRRGIASRLISASHKECYNLGYTSVTITTHQTNDGARKCYERSGYSFVGETNLASVYPHSFDAVHYVNSNI